MLEGCWQGCRKGEDVVRGREIRGSAGDEMEGALCTCTYRSDIDSWGAADV